MNIEKKLITTDLTISLAVSYLQAMAQTTDFEQPTEMPPVLIHEIDVNPNVYPETADSNSPQPSHCRPYKVTSVAWKKGSAHIAVGIDAGTGLHGCPYSGAVQIFDTSTPGEPRLLHTLPHAGLVYSVSYNHDSTRLAVGGGGWQIRTYNGMNPASPLRTLPTSSPWVYSIDYNHDGYRLAVGGG